MVSISWMKVMSSWLDLGVIEVLVSLLMFDSLTRISIGFMEANKMQGNWLLIEIRVHLMSKIWTGLIAR